MRIAIAGAGGIACSYAAVLASRDHEVRIWSPSNTRARQLAEGAPLQASGALEGAFPVAVADGPHALLADAPAVIVAVPAYGHRAVIEQLIPHLRSGQTVIISAHLSFAAIYLSRRMAEVGLDCPVVAWNTTASTGRQIGQTEVSISLLRRQVEMAVIPAAAAPDAHRLCTTLFGDRFKTVESLLSIDLGNLNPAVHYGIALFNLTRMERGETWSQQEHITPAVCRFLEDLDRERCAVAAALGLRCRTIHDSYAVPGSIEVGPLAGMLAKVVQTRRSVNGPKTLDTRYVTEDVPYGLLPMVRLAEMVDVHVPLHRAGILLFSSLYGRDFAAENRLLPDIAEMFASVADLQAMTSTGWRAAPRRRTPP